MEGSTVEVALTNTTNVNQIQPNVANIPNQIFNVQKIIENPDFSSKTSENPVIFHNEHKKTSQGVEKKRVEMRLNGFEVKTSEAWRLICDKYGSTLSQNELLSIAQVIAHKTKIRLDREAKRRKDVLIKWFEENLGTIKPIIDRIVLIDVDGNAIGKR